MTRPHQSDTTDDAVDWCLKLNERPLQGDEREDLRRWLARDPSHADQLDTALAVWALVGAHADEPELLAMRREALGAVHRAGQRRWLRTRAMPRGAWMAIAAALVLAVTLGMMLWQRQAVATYHTGIGERRVIALSDGSRLSLDADSDVAVTFSNQRRTIMLNRGRARFKVAKDPLRPFAVHSGDSVVVATGTEFSVERLAREIRVALFEGHVAVLRGTARGRTSELARRNGMLIAADTALTPGTELHMPLQGMIGAIRPTIANEALEDGQISFAGETLEVAAERMNRYASGRRIDVAPNATGIRVSGVFNIGDTDAFAQAIAATFPVALTMDEQTARIKAR